MCLQFYKEVYAMGRLVINGEEIYELDEECMREKYEERMRQRRYPGIKENKRESGRMRGREEHAVK